MLPEDQNEPLFAAEGAVRERYSCVVSNCVLNLVRKEDRRQLFAELFRSGAFREDLFLRAFEEAGFHGIEVVRRQREPWQVVEGIEFRSVTVVAHKGKQGPCLERNQALIYRGPFRKVEDDDGHLFARGERMAVCDKTFHLLQREPYAGLFDPVEPREEVPLDEARAFDCRRSVRRYPRETKGSDYRDTTDPQSSCCGRDGHCC